jgi:GTPase Era involved in 16S rRNA processing
LIEQTVKNHITETRWQEVFLLVAGLMRGKADKLLLAMEKEAQEYAKNAELSKFIVWVEQATGELKESVKPSAKRSIILFDRLNKGINFTKRYNVIQSSMYKNYIDYTPQFDEPFLQELDIAFLIHERYILNAEKLN